MTPRFHEGERVRVRLDWPEAGTRKVHIRTPHYLRGQVGVVERVLGVFGDPEKLAFGKPGFPRRPLYQVRFAQSDLWRADGRRHDGALCADIYEHWLEPAPKETKNG